MGDLTYGGEPPHIYQFSHGMHGCNGPQPLKDVTRHTKAFPQGEDSVVSKRNYVQWMQHELVVDGKYW